MSVPECACHYWSLYDLEPEAAGIRYTDLFLVPPHDLGAGDAAARRENERLRAHVERLVDEIWGRDR
jgi:hypothetical protein